MRGSKGLRFVALLMAFFLLLDCAAALIGTRYIAAGYVWMDDFEITRRDHPEKVWDKVFFGNSAVISAYREDVSQSGYVNLGLDYGVVTDLWDMLRRGHIDIGSELVVGLNYLTLYDDLETNPSYLWHRGTLEPYVYFQRDDLFQLCKDAAKAVLGREVSPPHGGMEKTYYYGSLSGVQLEEKMALYEKNYFHLPMEDFAGNLSALQKVAGWCGEHGVRLRVIWMPWNPSAEQPELSLRLRDAAAELCAGAGAEFWDFGGGLDATCFHDVGHLNYEYGAYRFTEEVDQWLAS